MVCCALCEHAWALVVQFQQVSLTTKLVLSGLTRQLHQISASVISTLHFHAPRHHPGAVCLLMTAEGQQLDLWREHPVGRAQL